MSDPRIDPASHYDRVTEAWGLLLGDELHYGLFTTGDETLPEATQALTDRMIEACRIEPGVEVLDVGCGTGTPACHLASLGANVLGITTSAVGLEAATERARAAGVGDRVSFQLRDGMDNGLPDASFDRVWVLESSHLMRERDRLIAECARVLKPGGQMALCDVMLRRPMPFEEVRAALRPLTLLREVFGDARMEEMATYVALAEDSGLRVEQTEDLTAASRPTFTRWRENAAGQHDRVVGRFGADDWTKFVDACNVLEQFWDEGRFGYGLVAASKP
jgi:cyclopropane fatty-acyl-phospholipid synthase-like methyltransferase